MPGKAAYLELENDPDLEFEFFLADRLHMTVARMREEMTYSELVLWSRYHARVAQAKELEAKKAG